MVREHLHLPERVKEKMLAAYGLIAEAESRAHGVPVQEIHFHEVGTMDAVADIAAVCLLMDRLAPDEVVVSPVHVGSGQVRCAHGILPVPAPAAAWILRHPAKMQLVAGTTKPSRLKEICQAADLTLTREEWYRLYLAAGHMLP